MSAYHYNMKADIDHNKPDIRTSKSHTGHTNGVHVTVYCTDNQSGCLNAASETLKGIKASANYTVTDRAGNVSDPSYVAVSAVQCHCSSCYTGENTCKYGCDQCMSCPTSCMESHGECHNDMGFACYKNYYSCRCSNCHTGHNTCAWGCDTCYN